ncbi:glycosyltransferase 1 domain-containing protein 1-like isoform X2 [Ostrea edulis]|uniref:glycosyltransferase 1 domain-containing protein 1-like isoform X2 n=1 Tax=Ostrea edulis TaxID=37623 RepID=UPI0024AE8B75|nr:glycosyltransferase 1 domain-containing protein 1-like isoform X2 [Ostrea edulis]
MSSTVLLLSPLRQASGNHSTIKRIRSHLESEFIICKEWDPADFDDEEQFLRKLRENNIDFVIALHAYKAGKYLSTKVPIPYILIFGGTDINQLHTDEDKLCKMSRAVEGARNIVAFSQEMMDKALQIWPDLVKSRASIIKQGIQTRPSALSLREVLVKHGHVSSAVITGATIFLFVGSIRPVKDPLYLINTMTEWHKERTDILYVIIGPEAMDLGTPVIARRNGGNEALIQHGVTGFLFSSPEEFKEIAESFSEDAVMQRKITIAAKEQIRREHLPEIEKNAYYKVMNGLKH